MSGEIFMVEILAESILQCVVTSLTDPPPDVPPPPPADPTTWNPSDTGGPAVVSGGNLTFSTSTGGNAGVRSTNPLNRRTVYFEIAITNQGFGAFNAGVVNGAMTPEVDTGNPVSRGAAIVWANGNISPSGSLGAGFSNGDVCCIAVDLGSKLIWFRKNGGNWNGSSSHNPATGSGGISFTTVTGPFYAFGGLAGGSSSMTANFGATAFAQSVPTGFSSWDAVAGA